MATYPDDAVASFTIPGFSSMIDRKPDKETEITKMFNVIEFTSEAGYEKRRLRSRRGIREVEITYTNINGLAKEAIETFYNARNGNYESFILDMSHINQPGIMRVRFNGQLSSTHNQSSSSNVLSNIYTVSFKLKEVNN